MLPRSASDNTIYNGKARTKFHRSRTHTVHTGVPGELKKKKKKLITQMIMLSDFFFVYKVQISCSPVSSAIYVTDTVCNLFITLHFCCFTTTTTRA